MSDKSQANANFLFVVLRHTPLKYNLRALADSLGLTPAATTMRITRLKRKLTQPTAKVELKDERFFQKMIEFGSGKTDLKGVAAELGLKVSAVSMRLTRLRKKLGKTGAVRRSVRTPAKMVERAEEREEEREVILVEDEDDDKGRELNEADAAGVGWEFDEQAMLEELERM